MGNSVISTDFAYNFTPEVFNFIRVKDGYDRPEGVKSVYRRGIWSVLRLSNNLWVCKKRITRNDGVTMYVVKWHCLIDTEQDAEYLFNKGLQG